MLAAIPLGSSVGWFGWSRVDSRPSSPMMRRDPSDPPPGLIVAVVARLADVPSRAAGRGAAGLVGPGQPARRGFAGGSSDVPDSQPIAAASRRTRPVACVFSPRT